MTVIVRPYTQQDFDQIVQCVFALQEYERGMDDWMETGEKIAIPYTQALLSEMEKGELLLFVAELNNQIIGFITVYPSVESDELDEIPHTYAYISDLVVLDKHRGSGMGKQLLQYVETYLREAGAGVVRIKVLAVNERAAEVYRKAGYTDRLITLEKRLNTEQDSGG